MTDSDDPTDHLPRGGDPRGDVDPAADAVTDHWEALMGDMSELADEYRDRGWDAHEIHPGDITTVTTEDADRRGIDVLAPDNEFDPVEAAVEAGTEFDNATVYRALTNGVLFLLVVLEDEPSETVVLVPAYYSPAEDRAFVQYLNTIDAVQIHVRPLDERTIVTFEASEPSLFLPDED